MGKHDLKCKELQVNEIVNKEADSIIEVRNVLRQTDTFNYEDFDLIPLWKALQLIEAAIIIDKLVTKHGSDVIDYELDLSAEDDIPYPANPSLYVNKKLISAATWDFSTKKWSGLPDTISGDVIECYFTGRTYVVPPYQATIIIENNSSSNVDYGVGAGTGTLLPGEDINDNAVPGVSVSVTIISGQTCVYTVYNEDGSVYFTHTLNGPGTENGLPMASNQSQSFIVTN